MIFQKQYMYVHPTCKQNSQNVKLQLFMINETGFENCKLLLIKYFKNVNLHKQPSLLERP